MVDERAEFLHGTQTPFLLAQVVDVVDAEGGVTFDLEEDALLEL